LLELGIEQVGVDLCQFLVQVGGFIGFIDRRSSPVEREPQAFVN